MPGRLRRTAPFGCRGNMELGGGTKSYQQLQFSNREENFCFLTVVRKQKLFSHSCEKIFVFFTIRKLKLLVAIYTVENGPFIKKSNLFFFFSKFTRIIAVLKWFPAVRWLFSRLLKLKSPLVSLVAFKLLEPGKQPTHSWKPFSHGKISKSVEKKKNKVLFLASD